MARRSTRAASGTHLLSDANNHITRLRNSRGAACLCHRPLLEPLLVDGREREKALAHIVSLWERARMHTLQRRKYCLHLRQHDVAACLLLASSPPCLRRRRQGIDERSELADDVGVGTAHVEPAVGRRRCHLDLSARSSASARSPMTQRAPLPLSFARFCSLPPFASFSCGARRGEGALWGRAEGRTGAAWDRVLVELHLVPVYILL